jgi:hypothetical protein
MMVRGEFAQLMAPGLHHLFVHWLDLLQRDIEYEHLFNIETSDKQFEDEVEFTGLGPMQLKEEGTSVLYQDAIEGGVKRYIHSVFALGCRVSWELYEDDQYNLIKQVPKAIARSSVFTREQQAALLFNTGFSNPGVPGNFNTTDGVGLFNTQHPLLGGVAATNVGPGLANIISAAGTYPNRPTTDVDLSITALQLMFNMFRRMTDGQGMPSIIRPKYLVIPPELKWIAIEILGSPNKPYTADNEINAILSEGMQPFVYTYLTGASPWFCLAEKESHFLKFFNRHPLDQDYADDFDTRSLKQIGWERYSLGATSWIGVWGSNGP